MVFTGKKWLLFFLMVMGATLLLACDRTTTTTTTTTTTSVTVPSSTETTTTSLLPSTTTTSVIPTTTTTTTTVTTTTTTTTTTTSAPVVSLEVTLPQKLSYHIGDSLDLTGLTVIYVVDGVETVLSADQYEVTSVDLSSVGTQTVFIRANGLTVWFDVTVTDSLDITMAYYLSAEGLSGQTLLLELRRIINAGFSGLNYTAANNILDETDADPNHAGNVLLVYTRASVSGVWDSGATWNKEHIFPQSLLGVDAGSTVNAASDLQNLKPCNPSVNSSRGNKYYDVTTTSAAYFPGNADKGDIARILLYMVVKYSIYTLVDSAPSTYQMGKLSVLLQWAEEDPVDDFERHRNDVIYSYQKNRNPFIDYPEFIDLIWG